MIFTLINRCIRALSIFLHLHVLESLSICLCLFQQCLAISSSWNTSYLWSFKPFWVFSKVTGKMQNKLILAYNDNACKINNFAAGAKDTDHTVFKLNSDIHHIVFKINTVHYIIFASLFMYTTNHSSIVVHEHTDLNKTILMPLKTK